MAKAKTADAPKIEVGKITAIKNVEFIVGNNRGSIYDGIYAALGKLSSGQVFTVPIPKNVDAKVFQNRTNAALRRGPVKPPDGCVFRKRTTVEGLMAICCIPVKDATAKGIEKSAKARKGASAPEKAAASPDAK